MINNVLTTILSYVLNKRTILELYVLVFISVNCFAKSFDKEDASNNNSSIVNLI